MAPWEWAAFPWVFPGKDSSFHLSGWLWAGHSSFADLCQAGFVFTSQALERLWLSLKASMQEPAPGVPGAGVQVGWEVAGLLRRVLFLPSWGWCCVNKIMYFFCLWQFCVDCCYKGKNPLNILNSCFCIQSKNILLSGVMWWGKYWIFLVWATSIVGESSGCVCCDERASCISLQNRARPMVPLQQLRGENTRII